METRPHYVAVGAVVMIALAAAALFILWLGDTQREFDEYDVIFKDRVSGLSRGAQVSFNGIQKGQVSELTIDPDNPSIVRARVQVEKDTPIKTDTDAELELVGFTGLAIIQFVGGSPEAALLKDTVRGTPEILADAGGIAQIFEGTNDIIASAGAILSEENILAFNSILSNVDTLTGAFAAEEENIQKTLEHVAAISEDLAAMTDRLERASADFETLMGEDAPAVLAETQATIKEARALVTDLRGVVEENRSSVAAFTDQGLAQVGPALAEARRMFKTLDQVLREVDRDPRGYLLGESTPKYETAQ